MLQTCSVVSSCKTMTFFTVFNLIAFDIYVLKN